MDIEIKTNLGRSALDRCVRVVLGFWPQAVIDDGDTGERYHDVGDVPLETTTEVLVYRDDDFAAKWDELGAEPEIENTMVHLLYDPGYINVVVGNPDDDEMRPLLAEIYTALEANTSAISRERSIT
ncbi:MAG: hypothetical protein WD069_06900 [Planctomycetales bacterium]